MHHTDVTSTRAKTLLSNFDHQVERNSAAFALISVEQTITYSQLDGMANKLAHYLRSMGVGQGSLVGVFLERSSDMVIAVLAILKAGAAYVPLDPEYPTDRIALIIEDSLTSLIVTNDRVRYRLPLVSAQVVTLDGEARAIAERSSDPVGSMVSPSDLAYVIYTSGSTGRPKGVMVEHGNVASFFSAMDRILGTDPGIWLAVTSICFDISVLELLWTLTRGFTVVLHGEEGIHTISDEITRYKVTHFQSTPSLARMLLTDPRSHDALGRLKTVLLGGEALPKSLVATLRPLIVGEIFNMYGPTESTVWSTVYRIPGAADSRATIPIGQPLANTQVYLLDPHFQPVPDGEPGEIFLGGGGVVRGYWNQPELTATKFLPNPFDKDDRIYRTGDLARRLSGGDLEFLGRNDFQVKLRGFRIELEEIEAVLERNSAVRQAVVVARDFADNGKPKDERLVAYIVCHNAESLRAEDLRLLVAAKLPSYMVPSHFVFLDRLPLTNNGKLDRLQLPVPKSSHQSEKPVSQDGSPRYEIESIIAAVWAEALGVDQVDHETNVFDLGATSLMIPQVQIELQLRLAREISLVELFEFHTVSALAAHLAGESSSGSRATSLRRRHATRNQRGPE